MAWYEITYACGHVADVQIYGKAADRERKIAFLERGICKECWRAEQSRKEAEKAQEVAQVFGLVALEGSPKQIAWANTIRAELFSEYGDQLKAATDEKTRNFMKFLVGQSSAKYWIDRQGATLRQLAQEWLKNEGGK